MNPNSPLRRHPLREADVADLGRCGLLRTRIFGSKRKREPPQKVFWQKKRPQGFFERLEDALKAIGFFHLKNSSLREECRFFRPPFRFSPIEIVAFFGFMPDIPNELTRCTIPSASRLGPLHLSCLKATKIASGFQSPPGWWCHSCVGNPTFPVFSLAKKGERKGGNTPSWFSKSQLQEFCPSKLSCYQQDTVSCVEDEIWVKTVLVVSKLGVLHPKWKPFHWNLTSLLLLRFVH